MIEYFFSEDKRAKWNTLLYDYFKRGDSDIEKTIEDYFGIWTRLVNEYGPPRYPGRPLIFQDYSHHFLYRKIIRRGAIYYPLILMYSDVPLYHRTVSSTILPIHAQYPIAEALGATLSEENGIWIAPRVNQQFWEDCLVLLILEYELYIIPKVMTDPDSKETLVALNLNDEHCFRQ